MGRHRQQTRREEHLLAGLLVAQGHQRTLSPGYQFHVLAELDGLRQWPQPHAARAGDWVSLGESCDSLSERVFVLSLDAAPDQALLGELLRVCAFRDSSDRD